MTDYSKLAMRNDYDFVQKDFSKGVTSALSLQIPIFSGLGNIHAYQKARLDYKIVTDTEKQLRDGISAEAEMTYNKFQEAKQKYASAKESIAMAQEALRLATLMYDEGASTQLDVMGARLALTQSKLNYASSLYEYQMARYQLRKAAGILKGVL
jgi:outer membrane protein TolC